MSMSVQYTVTEEEKIALITHVTLIANKLTACCHFKG